jgi:hypothetical protein
MAIPSLDDLLDCIRDKLEGEMVRSRDGSKRFVTKHSQELVWKESDNLWTLSSFAKLGFDNTQLLEKNFLQTISILVSIGWREWSRFGDIFIDHRETDGDRDRTDNAIPKYTFELLAQPGFLGKPGPARRFLEERYAFCPIVVREGTSLTLEKGWRLPFIEEEVEIGRGSYGAVTKEVIAVRHFQSGSGESSLFNQVGCQRTCSGLVADPQNRNPMQSPVRLLMRVQKKISGMKSKTSGCYEMLYRRILALHHFLQPLRSALISTFCQR